MTQKMTQREIFAFMIGATSVVDIPQQLKVMFLKSMAKDTGISPEEAYTMLEETLTNLMWRLQNLGKPMNEGV